MRGKAHQRFLIVTHRLSAYGLYGHVADNILKEIQASHDKIKAASSEQAQSVEKVKMAAIAMEKVTRQNTESAEESAAISMELHERAILMLEHVRHLTKLVGVDGLQTRGSAVSRPLLETGHASTAPEPRAMGGKSIGIVA